MWAGARNLFVVIGRVSATDHDGWCYSALAGCELARIGEVQTSGAGLWACRPPPPPPPPPPQGAQPCLIDDTLDAARRSVSVHATVCGKVTSDGVSPFAMFSRLPRFGFGIRRCAFGIARDIVDARHLIRSVRLFPASSRSMDMVNSG